MDLSLYDFFVMGIGLVSQILFFARTLVQWVQSERAGKVLSPVIFWQISLVASIIMLVYGILRKDFAIILGQFLVYFIYIRNLQFEGAWAKIPKIFRIVAWIMPLACLTWIFSSKTFSLQAIIGNEDVSHWLMIWGIVSQVVFTSRFFYQWIFSEKNKQSSLPLGFWYISITGSLMIATYALFRLDLVLLFGQLAGSAIYFRNILIHFSKKGLFDILPFDLGVVYHNKKEKLKENRKNRKQKKAEKRLHSNQ